MFLRPVLWYQRQEQRRQLEAVPLTNQLTWYRLLGANGAGANGRHTTSVRTVLLGLSLFLILCLPMVVSPKKLKLIKTEKQNERESTEIIMKKEKKITLETCDQGKLEPSENYLTLKDEANSSCSEKQMEMFQSYSYLDLSSQLEFTELGAESFQNSNVDFNTLPKTVDIKAPKGLSGQITNCELFSSIADPNTNHKKVFETSRIEIAPKLSEISVRKKSNMYYRKSKRKSYDSCTGFDRGASLDSWTHVNDERHADSSDNEGYAMTTRKNEINLQATVIVVGVVGILCCLMRLYKNGSWSGLGKDIWHTWQKTEQMLSSQGNLTTLCKQMIFLSVCEKCLLPGQHLSSLYTLMFCSIITYCVGYAYELLTRQEWSLLVRVGGSSSCVRHLALSTTNILLEWTKAVTFITTVVFLLLMLGLEKGLKDYSPSPLYFVIAALYWVFTEKICRKFILNWMLDKRWSFCDSLEELYVPLYLQYFQLFSLGAFTLPCMYMGNWRIAVCGAVFVRMDYVHTQTLLLKLSAAIDQLSQFRSASEAELRQNNDRCSICLSWMTSARVTPCQHFYHAECLLNILKLLLKCPMYRFFICDILWGADPPLIKLRGGSMRPEIPPSIFNVPASCLPSPKPAPRPAKVEDQQLRYFLHKDKITSFDAFKPERNLQKQYENLIISRSKERLVCLFMTDYFSERRLSVIIENKPTLCSPLTFSAFKNCISTTV
ncbi:Zinc finger C3HC4 RING-type [Trinorchestia longiramus]|nr:Zinc finger C3HC4 RING-type [Trinorchestia longiramus]